jgi:hypothetical protein
MARVSIYVQDDLKLRMDAAGEAINWSELARPVFQAALAAYEHRAKGGTMETAIERLRASKDKYIKKKTDHGRLVGSSWAENTAEYAQLEVIAGIDVDGLRTQSRETILETLKYALDPDDEGSDLNTLMEGCPVPDIPPDLLNQPDAYLLGFIEGVQGFFNRVKEKI